MNSRQKGAAGEREFANLLKKHGFQARRGQQFSGGKDSPDVVSDLPIHFEVKRVERLDIHAAVEQSNRDAPEDKIAVVAHRKNGEDWLITMSIDDFMILTKSIYSPYYQVKL